MIEQRLQLFDRNFELGLLLCLLVQGRLEPIKTYLKNNKRGLGADKGKKKIQKRRDSEEYKKV